MKFKSQYICILQLLFLIIATSALYGNFLWNPLVFDDHPFIERAHPEFQQAIFSFDLRWLPYATLEWTRALSGDNLVWLRLENLALHITNVLLLFLFLRRLFATALPDNLTDIALSSVWLAFFGALIFALHPVAVYGVAYLIQRTILMATLFALLTWYLFMEGLIRQQQRWLLASAVTYLLAVLAKEHAIMVPAVAGALLLLLRKPTRSLFIRVGPTFLLYGAVAIFIVYQMKIRNVLGYAYEPDGPAFLLDQGINPEWAYPLSILTQSFLYFKYCWLWWTPNPHWMSINMLESFAPRFWIWPETAGLIGFIAYPVVSIRWLLQRGRTGLSGFALLCPWLLFATELSTVRIQEIFVLYRSYLWMPGIFAILPFLLHKCPAKYTVAILVIVCAVLAPVTWNRLVVFSDTILLWDEAARYNRGNNAVNMWRIYQGRGMAYAIQNQYPQALKDFNEVIRLTPQFSPAYSERAIVYQDTGHYDRALDDYNTAIRLDPNNYFAYLGRAQVHEALGNPIAALQDYAQSCRLGVKESCSKSQWDAIP